MQLNDFWKKLNLDNELDNCVGNVCVLDNSSKWEEQYSKLSNNKLYKLRWEEQNSHYYNIWTIIWILKTCLMYKLKESKCLLSQSCYFFFISSCYGYVLLPKFTKHPNSENKNSVSLMCDPHRSILFSSLIFVILL